MMARSDLRDWQHKPGLGASGAMDVFAKRCLITVSSHGLGEISAEANGS